MGAAKAAVQAGKVTVSAEIRDTSWGRDLIEAGTENLIVRPYPDASKSRWTKVGRDRRFTRLAVAAWIFAWTDQTGGYAGRRTGREAAVVAVTLLAAELEEAIKAPADVSVRLLPVVSALVSRHAPHAPEACP